MDNVLKPFIFAHGLSTPIPVIFVGVIGGVLAHGVAGLFVGPVVLAVVWELANAWIADEIAATQATSRKRSRSTKQVETRRRRLQRGHCVAARPMSAACPRKRLQNL